MPENTEMNSLEIVESAIDDAIADLLIMDDVSESIHDIGLTKTIELFNEELSAQMLRLGYPT
jgi:hypothetical protein